MGAASTLVLTVAGGVGVAPSEPEPASNAYQSSRVPSNSFASSTVSPRSSGAASAKAYSSRSRCHALSAAGDTDAKLSYHADQSAAACGTPG